MNPVEFLKAHTERVRPLVLAESGAWWELNTTGSAGAAERAAKARERIARLHADPEGFAFLRDQDGAGSGGDSATARQIRTLRLAFEAAQRDEATIRREAELSAGLEVLFASHRPVIRDAPASANDIRRILRTSTDSDLRREAFLASHEVGTKAEPAILELVALRNDAARKLGYRDHYALTLAVSEIDEEHLLGLLDGLMARTAAPFAAAKGEMDRELAERFGVAPADLMPWHYADPFFQTVPTLAGV
ncbi:MAG: M2 family metallopeptidase, partial [Planctomycetes bacterium]|nr:M2 family metallopeptidase [Planctomycetota bacterium]